MIKTSAPDSAEHNAPESHNDIEIEIGGSSNPPGFDEELIGMSLEETKTFVLNYPDDHESKGLAGTEVAYKIKLKLIRKKILPELDDDFARDLGKFDSLEALTTQVKTDLASQAELDADGQVRSELLQKLANSIMLVIDEIARKESLTIKEEEFEAELKRQAERAGRTLSAARALLEKDGGIVKLKEGLRREKTIDFILKEATIVTA